MEGLDLHGIGKAVAFTPNEAVNSLVCIRYAELFGSLSVYQVSPHPKRKDISPVQSDRDMISKEFRGKSLFSPEANFSFFNRHHDTEARIEIETISEAIDVDDIKENNPNLLPLFIVRHNDSLIPVPAEDRPDVNVEDRLITLHLK
jgi:xanthine dehydrogenase molybdopterin-binding subunit B